MKLIVCFASCCFRHLIPIHDDLRFVGSLPPLDAPHHQRSSEWNRFREGVVLKFKNNKSIVDIGLEKVIAFQLEFKLDSLQNAIVVEKLKLGVRVALNVGHRPKMVQESGQVYYSAKVKFF